MDPWMWYLIAAASFLGVVIILTSSSYITCDSCGLVDNAYTFKAGEGFYRCPRCGSSLCHFVRKD